MVTVIDYIERQNSSGKDFFSLILQGDLEVVTSKESGKLYFTARRSIVPSTLNEASCVAMIGKELPGSIQRVSCEPYEYTLPDTGETIELDYRWEYTPMDSSKEHSQSTFSNNGLKAA